MRFRRIGVSVVLSGGLLILGPATVGAVATLSLLGDLSITGTASPDPVQTGQILTYQLTVANAGPDSSDAIVTDTLPTAAAFVSASAGQGSCSQTAGVVTCELAGLASGAQTTVTIEVTPTVAGVAVNVAAVVGSVLDPDPLDNAVSLTTTVIGLPIPTADLALSGAASPDPVGVGQALTYELTVANAGLAPAAGVLLTDSLPVGATFGSASASQGTCTESAGVVTCDVGQILAAGEATATIAVTPTVAGPAASAAAVTSITLDLNPANNVLVLTTTVNGPGSGHGSCRGLAVTLLGTTGRDDLRGTSGDDVIAGLGGNDLIRGSRGNDVICGGAGNDVLRGGAGGDVLVGQSGNDRLVPGPGSDRMVGGIGTDLASFDPRGGALNVDLARHRATGQGSDRIRSVENASGSRRDDVLRGTAGANTLRGLGGHDRVFGRSGRDALYGGSGRDRLDGGGGSDLCRQGHGRGVTRRCER